MKKYLLCLLLLISLLISGIAFAKPGDADYSGLLKVSEVESVTGKSKLSLKSMDSKKSGEAYDLKYSTSDGHAILMIQVLRGSDYEMYYQDYRCQDYRAMEYAFWGPKTATPENPPSQLWFRKGDTLIFIESGYDKSGKTDLNVEMMEQVAKIIASRL
jgi:hypothetical protein